jgi:hypothetical protein
MFGFYWKNRGISTRLKTGLFRATAFTVASYGCESWDKSF